MRKIFHSWELIVVQYLWWCCYLCEPKLLVKAAVGCNLKRLAMSPFAALSPRGITPKFQLCHTPEWTRGEWVGIILHQTIMVVQLISHFQGLSQVLRTLRWGNQRGDTQLSLYLAKNTLWSGTITRVLKCNFGPAKLLAMWLSLLLPALHNQSTNNVSEEILCDKRFL